MKIKSGTLIPRFHSLILSCLISTAISFSPALAEEGQKKAQTPATANAVEVSESFKKAIEERRNFPVSSEIITNPPGSNAYSGEIKIQKAPARLWELTAVFYTKEFAEKEGFPLNLVTKLPQGVALMEYTQFNSGMSLACQINMLLNKSLGLEFPEEEFVRPPRESRLYLPRVAQKPATAQKYIPQKMTDPRYSINFAITTMDHRWENGKIKGGGIATTPITYYSPNLYDDLDYLSLPVYCDTTVQGIINRDDPAIWIKKKGKPEGGPVNNSDDFYKIPLPKELLTVMRPAMEEGYRFIEKEHEAFKQKMLKKGEE